MPSVLLHPDVEKRLQQLPDDIEARIRKALATAGERPERELKPLTGRPEYSLRIGDRRALVIRDRDADELLVQEIDTRDTVYD
jgi:mRNA-degrading endonuclease RelE of RelBE toxin-antitoxin system